MTNQNLELEEIQPVGPGASSETDFDTMNQETGLSIDKDLIESLESQIAEKKEEIKSKVYAVNMTEGLLDSYEKFVKEEAEWNSTEALGVKEIHKQIQKIRKEGIKNGVILMSALPLEATHYFLSKSKGKGLASAEAFLSLYKPFDMALSDAKRDAAEIKDLEKQLAAAMQGISLG
jgi:type I site-specific restriction-modification system R (restriction) subunit